MTRKDYELIANVLRVAEVPQPTKRVLAVSMAEALANDNDRFDKMRFIQAATGDTFLSDAEVRRYMLTWR